MLKKIAIAVIAIAITIYYFLVDPASISYTPPCLFHRLTGWNCWGCGGQRAFHQLLNGNLSKAFHLNALTYLVLPLLFFVVVNELTRFRPSYPYFKSRTWQIAVVMVMIGFTFFRNIIPGF